MREILFRGKRTDNGEWIEGFYYQRKNPLTRDGLPIYHGIADYPPFGAEVIPETVGQYTGFKDQNGTRIFESDIVEFFGSKHEVVYESGSFGLAYVIDWETIEKQIPICTGCDNDLSACLNDDYISLWELYWNLENDHDVLDTVKILGNIHDNPELLEE